MLAACATPAASAGAAAAGPDAERAASPAGAAGVYGGGAVRDYLQFVSLRVTPKGRFTARATLVTKCAPRFGDALTESVAVRDQAVSSRGRYSATTAFSDDIERGVPDVGGLPAEGPIVFSARLHEAAGGSAGARDGRASGFIRVRTTYVDPGSGEELARCDTGRIRWVARRPGLQAGAGTVPGLARGRALRGTTGQGEPFLMRTAAGGGSVRRAGLTVRVGCVSAVGLSLDVVAHRVRIRRGRFGARDTFRRTFTYPDGREVVERYAWRLRGRFGERGARGTFRMRGVVTRVADGRRIGSCSTGSVAWRAVP